MLEHATATLQDRRLSDFLAFYLPRQRDWYRAAVLDPLGPVLGGSSASLDLNFAERPRVYKRDDDLADEFMATPEFHLVLEALWLRRPLDVILRATVNRLVPELESELMDLLTAALCVSASRVKREPSLLPWRRRLAARSAVWRLALASPR